MKARGGEVLIFERMAVIGGRQIRERPSDCADARSTEKTDEEFKFKKLPWEGSRKRAIRAAKKIQIREIGNPLGVFLTYPKAFPTSEVAVRDHLKAFVRRCRRGDGGRDGIYREYCGVIEGQQRGAPTIQLAVWPVGASRAATRSQGALRQVELRIRHYWIKSLRGFLRRDDRRIHLVKVTTGDAVEALFRYNTKPPSPETIWMSSWISSRGLPKQPVARFLLSHREIGEFESECANALEAQGHPSERRYANWMRLGAGTGNKNPYLSAEVTISIAEGILARRRHRRSRSFLDVIAPIEDD